MAIVTPHSQTPTAPIAPVDKQPDSMGSPEKVTEAATAPKTEEALSPKFAALARKEKALRAQAQAERAKLETERQALAAERKEIEEARAWKSKLKDDPFSVLTESGITYEQLTERLLNQPGPQDQAVQAMERKLAAIEAAQKQTLTQAEAQQKQQYEDAKKAIRAEVTVLVDGNEAFETIAAMDAHDAVVSLIEEIYQKDGVLMSAEDAAKEVEEYLLEEAMKIAGLKKIKSRMSPPPAQVEAEKPQDPKQQPQMNTLSNRMSPSGAKPMSARDRRDRAIKAFMGQLN